MDEILSSGMVQKMVEYAPAVFILAGIALNQQRIINKFIATCLNHLNEDEKRNRTD